MSNWLDFVPPYPVDQWSYYSQLADYGHSQLGADGGKDLNRLYDCVPDSFDHAGAAIGLPWISPQRWADIAHPGRVGGMLYGTAIAIARQFWGASCPPISDYNPANTLQGIWNSLAQGLPTIVDILDDRNAQLVTKLTFGSHSVVVVAMGRRTISILNVWNDALQTFSHQDFALATTNCSAFTVGNIVTFHRPLIGWKSQAPAPASAPQPIVVAPEPPKPAVIPPAPAPTTAVDPAPTPSPASTPPPAPAAATSVTGTPASVTSINVTVPAQAPAIKPTPKEKLAAKYAPTFFDQLGALLYDLWQFVARSF